MITTANRETTQLLDFSDDLDLSDQMEAMVVESARKKRFRRKRRPRSLSSTRSSNRIPQFDAGFLGPLLEKCSCSVIILWSATAVAVCWLIILSYMISAMNSENKRLSEGLLLMAATNQNLPETLQEFHAKLSALSTNQTSLFAKFGDLQQSVESLRNNFTAYKTLMDAQQNYAKDEKLVADFGAKIVAVATDVESIKEHYNEVVEKQKTLQNDLATLQSNFTDIKKLAIRPTELPSNYTEELKIFKTTLLGDLKSLETNLSVINDTLSQQSDMLRKELVSHKTELDELMDRTANITSHVASIEGSWPEYRQKMASYETYANRFDADFANLKNRTLSIESSLQNMCSKCKSVYAEEAQHEGKHAEVNEVTQNAAQPLLLAPTVKNEVENGKVEGDIAEKP